MTVRQIETFITLAETKSFTETANRLFLTQPAVSQQIAALEKDINCTLFIRSKTGLALSPAGKLFYAEAGSLLSHTNSVYRKMRQSSSGEKIVRTLCYLPPLTMLPHINAEFSRLHPEILLSVSRADLLDNNSQMLFEQHDISIAFGDPEEEYPNLQFIPLYSGRIVCIVHKDHPLAGKKVIRIPELLGNTIYSMNERPQNSMLRQLNYLLRNSYDTSFFPTLFGVYDAVVMASSGDCVCIVPEIGDMAGLPCVAKHMDVETGFNLGLYISENAPQDVLDFCEIAKRICAESDRSPVIY